ncbi:hypothetical protein T01_14250 [Trichinella spiralis]|uniref:Uncharacterized protein n=1 Tax=Trichinella spiralis TaxID=6334 RepID=A0A0V1BEV1_TRISP|nr:hypothetical protein T01_14250 [Trichinella spiralis]
MFGVSEKRLLGYIFDKAKQHTPLASIKVAVAGERAQFSFDVVFSAVVALRCSCGWVPAKTASSGMLQVKPFVSSIGGEVHDDCFPFVVSHVALVFTSLPRMIASITFALNEMRNQNGNSELKKVAPENTTKKKIELKIETAGRAPRGHRMSDRQNKNRSLRTKALAI